jgi:hypothetical protein
MCTASAQACTASSLAYGWRIGDWAIIAANAATLALAMTILATKLLVEYRARRR